MSELPKILVVDSGRRPQDSALSTELAEMGFASITTPFETADEVLAMIASPVAIVLQMSRHMDEAEKTRFLALAARLRGASTGIPVIVTGGLAGTATMLQDQLGPRAVVHEPSL